MLCANPDLVVHRGEQLVYCAGSLAANYEKLGGAVIYYGKPHLPIYESALAPRPGGEAAGNKAEAAAGGGRRALDRHQGRQRGRGSTRCSSPTGFMARRSSPILPTHLADLFARFGARGRQRNPQLAW